MFMAVSSNRWPQVRHNDTDNDIVLSLNSHHFLSPNSPHMEAGSSTMKNDAKGLPSAIKSDAKRSWLRRPQ